MTAVPVYSQLLISNAGFTGTATFGVPDGYTCVVRDIDVVVGISTGLLVYAYAGDGAKFAANQFGVVSTDFTLWSWRGRQIVPGGDIVSITTTGECDIRMSGYLLTGTGP